jgi:hypothetical protein
MLAYLNRAPAARQAARADYLARAARYLLLPIEDYEGLSALREAQRKGRQALQDWVACQVWGSHLRQLALSPSIPACL